jgi:hypothetical protein
MWVRQWLPLAQHQANALGMASRPSVVARRVLVVQCGFATSGTDCPVKQLAIEVNEGLVLVDDDEGFRIAGRQIID